VTPGTARNATDPINALLNLSYRLVEAEGHLATLALGLDPGMGILHADLKGRASLVLDLIEAVRPVGAENVIQFPDQGFLIIDCTSNNVGNRDQ
jgi:CRISPR/Cas system-associated endonuclease Cas1